MSRLYKGLNRFQRTSLLLLIFVGLGMHMLLVHKSTMAGELTPIFPGYPEVFDLMGTLDYMDKDTIVVNDASFTLLPTTTYHAKKKEVHKSAISKGEDVGLLITEDNSVVSVWYLGKNTNVNQNISKNAIQEQSIYVHQTISKNAVQEKSMNVQQNNTMEEVQKNVPEIDRPESGTPYKDEKGVWRN